MRTTLSRPLEIDDKIEVERGITGPVVTAIVLGTGRENGQAVVDYKTLSGDRHWAYLFQIHHVYAKEPIPA